MSIFKDFIPADQDAGAQGNGKFMDFVPPAPVVEAPVETVEVTPVELTLMDHTKPELLAMAAELGITDKKTLRTKDTIVAAIEARQAEVVVTPEESTPEVVEAPVVASLSDAPIEDATSIIQ